MNSVGDLSAAVEAFVRNCLNASGAKQPPLDLGVTTRAEAAGIVVKNLLVGLDHDYTRHALLHHGSAKERLRGQEPVTAEDFAKARQLFDEPAATVEPGEPPISRNGAKRIQVRAEAGEWRYTAVYEVRRTRIVLFTLFKRRI